MVINTRDLLNRYNSIKAEFSSLEEKQMNLFGELANICNFDWHDGHSINFAAEIEQERLEADKYKSYVLNRISILEFIYNKYSSIGSIISCNLNKKSFILSSIDASIGKADSILNKFAEIDMSFPYPEFDALYNKQQDYIHIRNKLSEIRYHFETLFYNIESIENEVANKIRSLEEFYPREFHFSLQEQSKVLIDSGTLDENMFALDYKKIEFYRDEERSSNNKLYDLLNGIRASYNSPNLNLYSNSLLNFKNNINTLYNKRNTYLRTLDLIPPIYGINIQQTLENFKKD